MEAAINLDKLIQHYQAIQALMLDGLSELEYHRVDRELEALEYQIDIATRMVAGE